MSFLLMLLRYRYAPSLPVIKDVLIIVQVSDIGEVHILFNLKGCNNMWNRDVKKSKKIYFIVCCIVINEN